MRIDISENTFDNEVFYHPELVRSLLEGSSDEQRYLILFLSADFGVSVEIQSLIFECITDVNVTDIDGNSYLDCLIKRYSDDYDSLSARPDEVIEGRYRPLFKAAVDFGFVPKERSRSLTSKYGAII